MDCNCKEEIEEIWEALEQYHNVLEDTIKLCRTTNNVLLQNMKEQVKNEFTTEN